MNRTFAKAIWECMMYYFKYEDILVDKWPTRKDYILSHFSISSDDYDKFYNLYLNWTSFDMDNPRKIKVYDYIVKHW